MSENSTPEQRTEDPTSKRMGELRKQGSLFVSFDVVQAASLITGFLALQYMSSEIFKDMQMVMVTTLAQIKEERDFSVTWIYQGMLGILKQVGPDIMIIAVLVAGVSSYAVLYQTDMNIKDKKIDFKIFNLDPFKGIKRMFSVQAATSLAKAVAKLGIIIPIGYSSLMLFAPRMIELVHYGIPTILSFTSEAITYIFWKIAYILIGIAIVDYVWGKRQWLRMYRMTKEEVKDERKAIEGDEATKRKIQAKGLQRIMQRIRNSVPKADVVVTNPTHYAVALKYDRKTMSAPTVLAKGKGFIALQIRKLAAQKGIPVLERKALARALYASTEVGSSIPRDLFKAVAEVLAYVYRIKSRFQPSSQQVSR